VPEVDTWFKATEITGIIVVTTGVIENKMSDDFSLSRLNRGVLRTNRPGNHIDRLKARRTV
jgi:hypothetical protein